MGSFGPRCRRLGGDWQRLDPPHAWQTHYNDGLVTQVRVRHVACDLDDPGDLDYVQGSAVEELCAYSSSAVGGLLRPFPSQIRKGLGVSQQCRPMLQAHRARRPQHFQFAAYILYHAVTESCGANAVPAEVTALETPRFFASCGCSGSRG